MKRNSETNIINQGMTKFRSLKNINKRKEKHYEGDSFSFVRYVTLEVQVTKRNLKEYEGKNYRDIKLQTYAI